MKKFGSLEVWRVFGSCVGLHTGCAVRRKNTAISGVDLMEMEGEPQRKRSRTSPSTKSFIPAAEKLKHNITVKGDLIFGLYPTLLSLQARKREFYNLYVKASKLQDESGLTTGVFGEILKLADEQGLKAQPVSSAQLRRLIKEEVHQGVAMDASPLAPVEVSRISASEMEVSTDRCPLWVLLDRIQDPMNFGAVLRSSYYFGVGKIFTVKDESCRLSPVVSKASSGALEVLDIYSLTSPEEFVTTLKKNGWTIAGTSADATCRNSCALHEASALLSQKHVLLIVGNEGKGVQPAISSLCDVNVFVGSAPGVLPTMGSLNVSVATGILLHELCRGRA